MYYKKEKEKEKEMTNMSKEMAMEISMPEYDRNVCDDDGRVKRTGSLWTASAHIITAVIGSGVLSLAWAIAQLGWVAGPVVLMAFSFITWFMSTLLVDCYRTPDPVTGKRNYTYMDVVRANLGGAKIQLCGIAQYGNLVGTSIGYTITASISMAAIYKSNCYHKHGHQSKCYTSNNPFMIIFASFQVVLSQIPNFHKLWFLSIVAAIMSFAYSSIGLALSLAKIVGGGPQVRTTLTGVTVGVDVSGADKVWRTFQAIGDIAFAYSFSTVLIEIQDTLKSSPPENRVMNKATLIGVSTTTIFYMLCGVLGYAAFGNDAPGNFLTGFGFFEPYWLIDIANICIAVHLIGAYQVFSQPFFQFFEKWVRSRWPHSFFTAEHTLDLSFNGRYSVNFFRLVWRTVYVVMTAVVAMIFPFFNGFVGLLGAAGFWPLTVYFPVEMYIAQRKIDRFTATWVWLKILSWVCLIVSICAAVGSAQGLIHDLLAYRPFMTPHE